MLELAYDMVVGSIVDNSTQGSEKCYCVRELLILDCPFLVILPTFYTCLLS